MLKVRIIQAMMQIDRPVGWQMENIKKLARELRNIELYNSHANQKTEQVKAQWSFIV